MLESIYVVAQTAGGQQPSLWMSFVPMLLILGVFYLLLVAPMRKRQKELQTKVEGLQKGDKVVTNGGLHGEVAGTDANVVILKIADQVKVRVAKSAIAQVEEKGGA